MSNALHRVRRAWLAAAVSVAVAAAFAGGGCSQGDMPQGPAGDSWLSELIRLAPADYEPGWLYFANQKKMRDIAGADEFKGSPSLLRSSSVRPRASTPAAGSHVPIPWTYEGLTSMDIDFRVYGDRIYNLLGVDPFFIDEVIGVQAFDHVTPTFMAVKGGGTGYDQLPTYIEELGYYKRSYGELTYYQWYEDDENRISSRTREDPFRIYVPMMRVASLAVHNGRLFISKRTSSLLKALRTQQGEVPSLYDRKPFRELAEAMAPDVVSGFFLKPEFIVEGWANAKSVDTLDRYRSGESPWGILELYTAAALGKGIIGEQIYLVIGLHFSDSGAADRNIDELRNRWDTARIVLSDEHYNVDEPLNAFCAPLDARTTGLDDASILIARCPLTYYVPETPSFVSSYVRGTRPSLPSGALVDLLVQLHILHFLIPDPNVPAFRQ